MRSSVGLQGDRDVKRSTGRHRTAHTRHGDDSNVLNLDVGGRLGNEDQALIQEVQQTLVGLDGTLDTAVAVVTTRS